MTNTMNTIKTINLYDNEYIRYKLDGQDYAVCIHQDNDPFLNPRQYDSESAAHLYCWHRRYSLGDKHDYVSPEDFLYDLAEQYIGMDKIRERIVSGSTNIEVARADEMFLLIEHNPSGEQYVVAEAETENKLFSDENKRDILEAFNFSPISLLQTGDDVVILPLYLMDHSGLSISVSDFCDRWDSGQVGWAFAAKDEFVKQSGFDEKDWKANALKTIKAEVKQYDQYLTDDVYWAEIFTLEDGEWESADNCGGFYGSNILENGVCEYADGLYEALQSGEYTTGTAKQHKTVIIDWEFD